MHEDLLSLKLQLLQTGFPERLVKLPQGVQVAWREAGDASSDFAVAVTQIKAAAEISRNRERSGNREMRTR